VSNLRQIGLALNQYHGVHNQFPQGCPPLALPMTGRSVYVAVLPFLDAGPTYNAFNFQIWPQGLPNTTAEYARPAIFVCPSDPETIPLLPAGPNSKQPWPDPPGGEWRMAAHSYGFMFGTVQMYWGGRPIVESDPLEQMNGCFNHHQRISAAAITDGLSNTLFVAERAMGYINQDRVQPFGLWTSSFGESTLLHSTLPPNLTFKYTLRHPYFGATIFSASSFHPGGLNGLMGDGSVRFIKESVRSWLIDPETSRPVGITTTIDGFVNLPPKGVWQALTTRAGGEVIDLVDY
jgi:prepilin-type processing-associated H-X9-DG protein